MTKNARIAQLLRELADLIDEPQEQPKPRRKRRQREPAQLDRKPTDLQEARAAKILRNAGLG